ncbi:dGTPase [Dyella acidisoli]|uniref:Deoxyguanosinetriphosphate triphosphohydrolase n=1 Tax=Dyella acidisoli TaxID=1867834 RepID=A0ABQ5XIV2_9GAMM|nr:dGTPase [Dyella acidisoli]GLQ91272.1 deoxyguanosinetriphosphate triphosphohydrolase [Dyella acidisoli]
MARAKKNPEQDIAARYQKLLQVTRFRPSQSNRNQTLSIEAASDRGRILFSNAFRRLQSKTQVFDQELNASVRTRLTHSLEVASVGRYLADVAAREMLKKGWLGPLGNEETLDVSSAVVTFVEVACLMHDLGNPPFGHFGESTLQAWFENHQDKFCAKFSKNKRTKFESLYRDFRHFDGNPQGFRIATKLQWVKDEHGYNLTHTQLAAMLKYPWTPDHVGQKRDGKTIKKAGAFYSEEEVIKGVYSALEMNVGTRHPLAYLMEASDDISYCLSDIEDAFEKNVIRGHDFVDWLRKKLGGTTSGAVSKILSNLPEDADATVENESRFAWYVKFRTDVTNTLVNEAANLFIQHQEDILKGLYFDLLDRCDTAKQILGAVKDFSTEHLYTSRVVRQRELLAFEVITGILDRFGALLDLPSNQAYELITGKHVKNPEHILAPTLCSFLGKKQVLAYRYATDVNSGTSEEREFGEWFARTHLLVDYVSGMTDDYAIASFQRLYAGGPRYI